MKTRIEFEVETLREMLKASVEALNEIGGLTRYSQGWRDSRIDVLEKLDRILEEVSE